MLKMASSSNNYQIFLLLFINDLISSAIAYGAFSSMCYKTYYDLGKCTRLGLIGAYAYENSEENDNDTNINITTSVGGRMYGIFV